MLEYEIYRHRSAELREIAAHERLAAEVRRARGDAAGRRGPLARLTAGLRRESGHQEAHPAGHPVARRAGRTAAPQAAQPAGCRVAAPLGEC